MLRRLIFSGWRTIPRYLLSALSALILILSYPNFNIWLCAWVGFVPLFFAIHNQPARHAFTVSCLAGVIFWAGVLYWLVHVTIPGTALLVLYLALYFGAFGFIIRAVASYHPLAQCIFLSAAWCILEFIRSRLFTGFGWALLGYSQSQNLAAIQISDITGPWGVSFLIMFSNCAVYFLFTGLSRKQDGRLSRQNFWPVLVFIPVLAASLVYGFIRLRGEYCDTTKPVRVCVIQGNIAQEYKWVPEARDYILDRYIRLTQAALQQKPNLIMWPEASGPGILGEDIAYDEHFFAFLRGVSVPLVVGVVAKDGEQYFNRALLLESGKSMQVYDKLHLVPFGEYIPFRSILPFLQKVVPIGDVAGGRDPVVFSVSYIPAKFSVLICFEDVFPELSRVFIKQGAQFLATITNDAWYQRTSASFQHFQASVFRAVETRSYMVRSANTGVSGFISPTGQVVSLVCDASGRAIFVEGFLTEAVYPRKGPLTFYVAHGEIFLFVCAFFVLSATLYARRKRA